MPRPTDSDRAPPEAVQRRENLFLGEIKPGSDSAGWPTRMSKPFAAKGIGATPKSCLNTRHSLAASRSGGDDAWVGGLEAWFRIGADAGWGRLMPLPGSRIDEDARADVPDGCRPAQVELELLYRNQQNALVRFFTRYRASPEDARDLVQEAFLRFSGVDLRKGLVSKPEAYLRAIARNLLRERARSGERRAERQHVPLDEVAITDTDTERRLEARDSLARIEAAMRRMKPRTREIFMASRVHGLSYAEIAEITGMSMKGVEKQMSKAIAQLARYMDRS